MKTKTWIRGWVVCFAATVTGATAFGQGNYIWNTGAGDWNTTTPNWTGAGSAWVNGASSNAVFNNLNGTVTLTQGITGGSLGFNNGGRESGTHVLTLTGSTLSVGSVSASGISLGGNVDSIADAYNQRLTFQNITANSSGDMTVGRGMLYFNSATVNIGGQIKYGEVWDVFRADNSTVTATGGIDLSVIASGVELYGGTVTTPFIKVGNAVWDGASGLKLGSGVTLVPTGDSADYLQVFNNGDPTNRAAATLSSGGMTLDTAYAVTIATQLTGGGSLSKSGTGTLTLTQSNDYTGGTTVNNGMLVLASGAWTLNNVDGGGVTVGNGATLRSVNTVANRLNGLTLNGGTVDAVGGGNGDWGNFFLTGNVAASGNSNLNADIALRATNVDFNVANGGTLNVGGVMHNGAFYGIYSGDPATVSKSGAGTMTLTAINTYTGATTVNGGTLELAGATGGNGLIRLGAVTVNPGATLAITGGDGTGFGWNNPISSLTINGGTVNAASGSHLGFGSAISVGLNDGGTIAGSWQWNGDNTLTFSSSGNSTNTISGAVSLRSDNGANHTFTVADGAAAVDLLVSAIVSDPGASLAWLDPAALTKAGAGTMVLAANNTYRGGTTISAGTLQVGSGGTSGSLGSGAVVNNATLAFHRSDSLTVSDGISGSGSLQQNGGGTLVLSGNNTYSGATTVNAGTLVVGDGGSLAAGSALSVASGATFQSDVNNAFGSQAGSIAAWTIAGTFRTNSSAATTMGSSVTLNNGTMSNNGLDFPSFGNFLNGGSTVITANGAGNSIGARIAMFSGLTLNTPASGDALSVPGILGATFSGGTSGGVTKSGSGTVTLSGANTYAGGTTLSAGTLVAGNSAAFGSGGVSVGSGATLDLGGYGVSNAITNDGGSLLNAASYTGSQSVVGTTSLTGTVGGSLTVNSGGTLKGSGATFTGPVVIAAGGVHSPGNSPGSQAFTSGLSYAGSSALTWELIANTTSGPGTNYDFLSVTGGDLTITSGALLNLEFLNTGAAASSVNWANAFWDTAHTWTIIDFTSSGSSTGIFTLAGDSSTWLDSGSTSLASARPDATFSVANLNGDVVLSYAIAVPEPSSIALVGLGGLLAAAALRRRRS